MESLSNELRELGDSATVDIPRAVYACAANMQDSAPAPGGRVRSMIRGTSVASQFKTSLQSLVDDLEQTLPHYIRCIKPNLRKSPNMFASGEVLKQLRYSGMMEAIRIRREGYALREDHQSFYNRFSILLTPGDISEDGGEMGIEQLVKVLSARLGASDADWQIGHSKIFLRMEISDKLEKLAKLRVHAAARTLGRFGRMVAEYRSSTLLTSWARFRLVMIKRHRANQSSARIIAAYRRHRQVKLYRSMRTAIIKVQTLQRGRAATQRVKKMRDPYCDLTFKDLKRLLTEETRRMDLAVNSKDFRAAAEIEASL